MAQKNSFHVFAVSDATGDLANNMAISATGQFENIQVKISRKQKVTTPKRIKDVVDEAKRKDAVILFTMVSGELRRAMLSCAKENHVVAMDIMGPALDMLAHYFHQLPSGEPGLQYKMTRDYFKRTEAIEYSVRHDEGLGIDTLDQADVILLGISRTSKTPLSMYLAHHGYRCANIPVVKGHTLPESLQNIDRKKIVGLLIDPVKLASYRSIRMKNMGRPDSEIYAQHEHIEKELEHAREVYSGLGDILIVDTTGKAIEELATEIIDGLGLC